jgi:hypothetical protein
VISAAACTLVADADRDHLQAGTNHPHEVVSCNR